MNSKVSFCSEHLQTPALIISRAFHFGRSFSTEVHVECFHSDSMKWVWSTEETTTEYKSTKGAFVSMILPWCIVTGRVWLGQINQQRKDVNVVKYLFLFLERQWSYFPFFLWVICIFRSLMKKSVWSGMIIQICAF